MRVVNESSGGEHPAVCFRGEWLIAAIHTLRRELCILSGSSFALGACRTLLVESLVSCKLANKIRLLHVVHAACISVSQSISQ